MTDQSSLNGMFEIEGVSLPGQLVLAGRDTRVTLYSDKYISTPRSEPFHVVGKLSDGRRASLFGCISISRQSHDRKDERNEEVTLFPHYVVLGERHLLADETRIRAISYTFERAGDLVNAFKTFGSLMAEREDLEALLEKENVRLGVERETPAVGERPVILYYSGILEIVRTTTPYGSIAMHHRPSWGSGSSDGIAVTNSIMTSIEFAQPRHLQGALPELISAHQFFELCLGHRQRYLQIELDVTAGDEQPVRMECHWSWSNERVEGQTPSTTYSDLVSDPVHRREEFSSLLTKWSETEAEYGDARDRWAIAFHSRSYSIDRIVGAANMFDILPEKAAPSKEQPAPEIIEAVEKARALFKALPESLERQAILSALGRVGTASLRAKVRHRASIVKAAAPTKFAELFLPCDEAVLCRNHYVHGSQASFDYRTEIALSAFLTETLEFVFAVSDLIEMGWSYDAWREKGTSMSHAFGSYLIGYDEHLRALKKLLGET